VTPEETRDLLIRIADSFERMELENAALKAVMQNAMPHPGEAPLQTQLEELIEEAAPQNPIHTRYEALREEIQEAYENHQLQQLLMTFPPAGEPN
jgi:hypothetical protein